MKKKLEKNYNCQTCDYNTSSKKDFQKHKKTKKHLNGNKKIPIVDFTCKNCGISYKFRSGLSRHLKKCKVVDKKIVETMITFCPNLYGSNFEIEKKQENTQITEKDLKIIELEKTVLKEKLKNKEEIIEILKTKNGTIVNNTYNNKLTLNVFLNEHCKNALNLTDFVKQIEIGLEDLQYTKNHGFVKGITNIFTKQLNDLNPTERPIHCSDKKRLQFYIKDEGKWEKDSNKIDKSILNVQQAQIKKMYDWELANPGWKDNGKLVNEWQKIVHGITGSGMDFDKSKKKIKSDLSTKIDIKDQIKK
jgi:hypothetical protein